MSVQERRLQVSEVAEGGRDAVEVALPNQPPRLRLQRQRLGQQVAIGLGRQKLLGIHGQGSDDRWIKRATRAAAQDGGRELRPAEVRKDDRDRGHLHDPGRERDLLPRSRWGTPLPFHHSNISSSACCVEAGSPSRLAVADATSQSARWANSPIRCPRTIITDNSRTRSARVRPRATSGMYILSTSAGRLKSVLEPAR